MSGRFSVIIPTRGDSLHLRHALGSALRCPEAAEILLVAPAGLQVEGLDDRRVRLLPRPGPGVSRARNAGIEAARFPYLAFLDDDDAWTPQHLPRALDNARRHPDAVLFAANAWRFEDGTADASLSPPDDTSRLTVFRPRLEDGDLTLRQLLLENPITTPAVVLVREHLRSDDRFDPDLTHMEDYDLWLRLARDRRLVVDSRPSVLVRKRPGSASRDWRRMAEGSLAVLERFSAGGLPDGTVSPREMRARLGRLWHDLAYACLVEDDPQQGRRALRESIRRRPWLVKNYLYLLTAAGPARLRHAVFARGRRARRPSNGTAPPTL